MSLGRLLTAGKSLVGIKDSDHRYQMRARHLLPTFGAGKNPFAAPAAAETAVAGPSTPAPAPARSPAETAAAQLKETKVLPTTTAPALEPKPVRPESSVFKSASNLCKSALQSLASGIRKLKRAPRIPRVAPSKPAAGARSGKSAVQGELSLENIKVVRNDLSDTDVEMVPARSPARSRARAAQPAGETEVLAEVQS
jgi:hypothetical protein